MFKIRKLSERRFIYDIIKPGLYFICSSSGGRLSRNGQSLKKTLEGSGADSPAGDIKLTRNSS